MPDPLHDLTAVEHRIQAVSSVSTVMHAVWGLARAQLPLAEAAAKDASTYLDEVNRIVHQLAGRPVPTPPAESLWVVMGPERSLCGSLARVLLDQVPAEGSLALVGTRLAELGAQLPAIQERVVFVARGASTPDDLGPLADKVAAAILGAPHRTVVLLHPVGGTSALQPSVLLAGRREPVPHLTETFLPAAEVLEAAVIEAVAGRLAVALAEALRTEVKARLAASEAARRSCDRQLDELRHRWRVLRQDRITEELLELTAARGARWRRALPGSDEA